MGAQVEASLVALGLAVGGLGLSQGRESRVDLGVEAAQALLDPQVAVGNHAAVGVIEREALLKCEEVLGSVVALEGLGDALGGALTR